MWARAASSSADVGLIFAAQGVRAAGYGFTAVLLGVVLADRYGAVRAGLLLAAVVAGGAVVSLAVGAYADRLGRRWVYAGLYVGLAIAGGVLAVTGAYWVLITVALTGVLSTEVIDSGPSTTLEQAMLADTVGARSARVFGTYNAVAALTGSLGALSAGIPGLLGGAVVDPGGDRRLFAVLVPVGVIGAVLALALSARVESRTRAETGRTARRARLVRSRRQVQGLAVLFATDAFGGGFVVQSFLAFWLRERFGVSLAVLGALFFTAGLVQTASFLAAPRVADRIGLLPTMVFTHLPSNALLIGLAIAPTFPAAIGLLLGRQLLSQMDVPTRQAYVMALVEPAERPPAAAVTNAARSLLRPTGPVLAGFAAQLALAAPLIVGGTIKIGYDLALWRWFRRVPLPQQSPCATAADDRGTGPS